MNKIAGLSVFAKPSDILAEAAEYALGYNTIKKVVCCALGPKGNNIEQAATRWLERANVANKGEVVLRSTPEFCLELARSITEDGSVAVFWTCAVYFNENKFFFGNPDVFPFFFQETMPLDEMQLAATPGLAAMVNPGIPLDWRVASHPSPAPLVKNLRVEVVMQNSNAAAAEVCAKGEAELCITTESARQRCGLVKLHSFGSPAMVFFGGITQHGLAQIEKAMASRQG